ncbi:MAG: NAD(+)/NADH kinase [Bacteroidales bacterium]|nr:NAD(+)/NADH kinase [Bacteroidales bacterium]
MTVAIYIKKEGLREDPRVSSLLERMRQAGISVYPVKTYADLRDGTDLVMAVGGDGTFLSAAKRVRDSGIPVMGVNVGRLGFLSENKPEDVVDSLLSGNYTLEDRTLIETKVSGFDTSQIEGFWPISFNEVSVHRFGAGMIGIDVTVDCRPLPTYWADGLLVATSSGSTAYSLSAGGPICYPESKVLLITPIAPHNLNVRPLVVPESSRIGIKLRSRDEKALLTMDNRTMTVPSGVSLSISVAQFSLRRIRPTESNFEKALTSKLFWGEDIRNL